MDGSLSAGPNKLGGPHPLKHNRPISAELPMKEGKLGSPGVVGKFPSHNFLLVSWTSAGPRFESQVTSFFLDHHAGYGPANGPRCESETKKSYHSASTFPILADRASTDMVGGKVYGMSSKQNQVLGRRTVCKLSSKVACVSVFGREQQNPSIRTVSLL